MLGVAAAALALFLGHPADRQPSGVTSGVRAKIDFVSPGVSGRQKPRIRIWRNGRLVTSELIVAAPPRAKKPDTIVPLAVEARDLDRDGEPEVIVSLSSGGAYCCTWWRLYRFRGAGYVPQVRWWGDINAVPAVRDLDGDKRPELVSVDDRFSQLAPHVAAAYPLQIWQYGRNGFRDVTRQYPRQIAAHAAGLWGRYRRANGPARYVLAAWAADQYLLGRQREADRVLDDALAKGDLADHLQGPTSASAFVELLKGFLRRNGYA